MYAWEPSFIRKIGGIRDQELKCYRKYVFLEIAGLLVWRSEPYLVSLIM